jgi:XkdW protein
MQLNDILLLKYPDINLLEDVILQDDGDGPNIKEWYLNTPMPTQEDLENWALEFDLQYRQKQAVRARVYPSIGDQFDMQYKDVINNTTIWVDTIAAIKAAHPKPTE